MNHLGNQNDKSKKLKNMRKYRALKVQNSPLELEIYFKPITVFINDMDKITKNTWYN